jgi:FMN-dependent NADH-azoreductase
MQMLYDKVLAADRIVIAAPIFFASVPAQLKAFIDRFQCFWVAKYVLKQPIVTRAEDRRGFFLCAAGMKNPRFFDHARAVVRVFFTVMNFSYQGSLFYPGIDWAGQIEQHPNALFEAQEAGKAFMQR